MTSHRDGIVLLENFCSRLVTGSLQIHRQHARREEDVYALSALQYTEAWKEESNRELLEAFGGKETTK